MSQGLTENILLRTTDCLSAASGGVVAGIDSETPQDAHNVINLTVSANDGYQGRVFITPDIFAKPPLNRRQRRAEKFKVRRRQQRATTPG